MTGSLSDLPTFVADAFVRLPTTPFVPEDTLFGRFTFLPWVRTGIAAAVRAEAGQLRASATVGVSVAGGAAPVPVTQNVIVRGPGDVLSINERQVIRRYPAPGATRAEDSFLAHIEFDRPDFPWIFTPMQAFDGGTKLPPWVVLVVLRASRSDLQPASRGLPARVRTTLSELQPLGDSWAWAHAQVIGPKQDATTASVADRLLPAYTDVNLSRLICPRKLAADQDYLACLVPAFNAGVNTGLGSDVAGTLDPAWARAGDESDADTEMVLPVYASWSFGTSDDETFRSLAERLVPVAAPWQIGRRVLDTASPKGGMPDLAEAEPGRLQTVRGPLVSLQLPDPASDNPNEQAAVAAETAVWPAAEIEALRTQLNAPDALALTPGADNDAALPLIGPEIYARYQAAATRVEVSRDGDWFGELNTIPRNRVVAGLGTRVVQRDQEALMQSAWAQVGRVDAVNADLRRAQLARFAMQSLHRRSLSVLSNAALLQVTRAMHARVGTAVQEGAPVTLHAEIGESAVATSAVTAAMRRFTRPRGPIGRYTARVPVDLVTADGVARDHQRPYTDLDGVSGVSASASRVLDPAVVASVFGLPSADAEAAAQALVDHGLRLAAVDGLTDVLTPAAVATAQPTLAGPFAQVVGAQILTRIRRRFVTQQADDPVALRNGVGVVTALASVGGLTAQRAAAMEARLRAQWAEQMPSAGELIVGPDQQLTELISKTDDSVGASAAALGPIADDLVGAKWPGTPRRPGLALDAPGLLSRIDPTRTATARITARFDTLPSWLPAGWFDDGLLQPIMAGPVFVRPMYQALADYDREWLIPGLATMPEPDLVTALATNREFVEGFLVGLSHEMGRELLWRGYPTDQRNTYFRRFWNGDVDELTGDIHRFASTALGSHMIATLDGRIALLVRGELIRRHPDAVVLAMLAGSDGPGNPVFAAGSSAPVLFHDRLAPDIVIVGFDLTKADIAAHPWWFLLAEHPSAPRFGLAKAPQTLPPPPYTREDLAWGELPLVHVTTTSAFLDASSVVTIGDPSSAGGSVQWGADAATGAHLLLVDPVRAAFDGKTLLGPTGALA